MPPSKLIVNNICFPQGGLFIREGVIIKGGNYILYVMYIYIYI